MSLTLSVQAPNAQLVQQQIQGTKLTQRQLETFATEVGRVDMQAKLDYLAGHVRTGQTISSIRMRIVESNASRVTVAVGSQTRASQLLWLDRGRREVRPVNRRFLRWLTHPGGVVVYSKYSRATQGSNIMRRAASAAMSQASSIAQRVIAAYKDAALATG